MNNRILILAGDSCQATHLAKLHGLRPEEWGYVRKLENIYRGPRRSVLWLVGTWKNNPLAGACLQAARERELKVFTTEDDRHVTLQLED